MRTTPTIGLLEGSQTIFVLRDENGNSMGTGSSETLQVLLYIAKQTSEQEARRTISKHSVRSNLRAQVRSAIAF